MRQIDLKLINQIKRTHAKVTDKVLEVMLNAGCPSTEIQHIFLGAEDDEYIVWGKSGFHVTVDWDQDGKVTCSAEPGEFIESSAAAPMWIKRITTFHRTVGNQNNVH
jgi:hypothetical protein